MTSIFETPTGQMHQFIQNLHTAGITYEDVVRVNKNPEHALWFHEATRPNLVAMPSWWRTIDQQLEAAKERWPNAVFPSPPVDFSPKTETEVLLLHVPDTFESLWSKIRVPKGYSKGLLLGLGSRTLRLDSDKSEYDSPVWLAFDPEHGKSKSPDRLDRSNLAASEVLSALVQFPDWITCWGNGWSKPLISGYRVGYHDQTTVPFIDLGLGSFQINVTKGRTDFYGISWASPSVREC